MRTSKAVAPAGLKFDRVGDPSERSKKRRGKAAVVTVKERKNDKVDKAIRKLKAVRKSTGKSSEPTHHSSTDDSDNEAKAKQAISSKSELDDLLKRKAALEKRRKAEADHKKRKEELRALQELGMDGAVDVMTTRTHGLAARLRDAHTLGVYCVDYTHDGKALASCSHDSSVVVWDVDSREPRRRYRGNNGPVFQVQFSPDRKASRLATVCYDGYLRVFVTANEDLKLSLPHPVSVQTLAWSPAGDQIATGCKDGALTVWNVTQAEAHSAKLHPPHGRPPTRKYTDFVQLVIAPPPMNPAGHVGTVRRVRWHSSNTLISCSDDHTIRIWNARHMSLQRKIAAHSGPVLDININGDGSRLISCSQDGSTRIWMFKTGKCAREIRGHRGVVYSAIFTAEGNGRRVITSGQDRCVNVHYAHDGTMLQRMKNIHKSFVFGLCARGDGLQFATAGGDHTIGVWRAQPSTKWGAATTFCKSLFHGLAEVVSRKGDIEPDAVGAE